jgi:hypothetical protein
MSTITSKSVTLSKKNYLRLTQLGYADETADNVIGRILDVVEEIGRENR